ncbi:DUF2892 domain-containing protein [Candidatus Gracilibacteria bacterium]|nr:DUF2892 domain-containing protein [Candidatus Gracilibacteria bacterium]
MSTIHYGGKEKFKPFEDHQIIVLCQSGNRAAMSKKIIENDCSCNVRVYEGGLLGWKGEGKETFGSKGSAIPLMRQVQVIVGFLVLTFGFLTYFVNSNFVFGAMAVAGGLFFAGLTGNCLLASLIGKLPYNNK